MYIYIYKIMVIAMSRHVLPALCFVYFFEFDVSPSTSYEIV